MRRWMERRLVEVYGEGGLEGGMERRLVEVYGDGGMDGEKVG